MARIGRAMSTSRDELVALIAANGKYLLRQENNEGMNAFSFLARHLSLDRETFLKVYDADRANSEVYQEPRFLVEATRGRDGSGNLVEIYDAERLGQDYVLLAMEYVSGGSLLNRITCGRFALMDSGKVAVGILHGVAQLHSKMLVHRDIKPANVLVTQVGSTLIPKLGDFGSVARLTSSSGYVSASRHSALYVPPEGWANPSVYTTRSDLYQVGIVLHEMVNG